MSERKLFEAIEAIEAKVEQTHIARQLRNEELLVEHLRRREPLLQRRYELVTGLSPPTDEELQGFAPQGGAAAAAPPASKSTKGVPFFWLNALCNEESLAPLISARDRCALEYLEDVRYVRGPHGMAVEFYFGANPFFHNKVLRKGIYVKRSAKGGRAGPIEEAREEATDIEWKEGRSLLYREVAAVQKQQRQAKAKGGAKQQPAKKAKQAAAAPSAGGAKKHRFKKGEPAPDLDDPVEEAGDAEHQEEEEEGDGGDEAEVAAAGGSGKRKPCPSFFRFFLPLERGKAERQELDPTALEEEEEESEEEEEDEEAAAELRRCQERDSATLDVIIKRVVPGAARLYLAAPLGGHGKGAHGRKGDDNDDDGYELVSGSPASDVGSLPLATQRVVHALRAQQAALDEMGDALRRGEFSALKEQAAEVARLADQRRQALLAKDAKAEGGMRLAIPGFWLRALKAGDASASAVHARDERALSYLADARLEFDNSRMPTLEEPTRSATLQLEFLPNPYFANSHLRKRFTFACAGGSINKLSVESAQAEPIDWKEGRDLTTRRVNGRSKAAPTFFALFKQGALRYAFGLAGQGRAVEEEALELQEAMLNELANVVLQFPGRLARNVPFVADDLGDERLDEEDSEESEEEGGDDADGSGDDDDARGRRAAAAAARKAARDGRRQKDDDEEDVSLWARVRKNQLLMAFLALVVVAQVLVYIEMIPYVRHQLGFA